MAYIRGQSRFVEQSVVDYLTNQLMTLGWMDPEPPYAATQAVSVQDFAPPKNGPLLPNTVAITTGVEPDDEEGELGCAGGGLWRTEHTFFIDVYAESQGIAKALVEDVRAVLIGKLPGTKRYLKMTDYSQTPPVEATGHLLHFEDVVKDTPTAESKLHWRVVKATCIHEFNASEG